MLFIRQRKLILQLEFGLKETLVVYLSFIRCVSTVEYIINTTGGRKMTNTLIEKVSQESQEKRK